MRICLWVLALSASWGTLVAESGRREAPAYSSAGIVNAATNLPGALAPNTIATIYGTGLATASRAVSADDVRSGTLPLSLPGTGVRVSVGNIPAPIYYVSPTQVNLLVPNSLLPGQVEVQLTLDGRAGPAIPVQLAPAAPALFHLTDRWIVACRPDGEVITEEQPARPGEIVILYATGLGRTAPDFRSGELPSAAAPLERLSEFQLLLDDAPVARDLVLYAGVTPGFAGLYQINLRLPEPAPRHPEVRLKLGSESSPPGAALPLAPE